MTQSKTTSLIESCTNTFIGLIFSVFAQILIFPLFGIHVSLLSNIGIAICFTFVSVVRGYLVRRWFNRYELARSEL